MNHEGNLYIEDKTGAWIEKYVKYNNKEVIIMKKRNSKDKLDVIKALSTTLTINNELPKRFKSGTCFKVEFTKETGSIVMQFVCTDYKQTSKWVSCFKGTVVFERSMDDVLDKEKAVHVKNNRTVGGRGDWLALPFAVSCCIRRLDSVGYKKEGLFRVSGLSSDICKARQDIENNVEQAIAGTADFNVDVLNAYDQYTVACLLKLYLRSLPDPAFTSALYSEFCEVGVGIVNSKPESDTMDAIKKLLSKMTDRKYTLLKHVLGLVYRVSLDESENKMSAHNLGVVLAPSMLRNDKETPMEALMKMNSTVAVVRTCITNYENLFGSGLDKPFYYGGKNAKDIKIIAPKPAAAAGPSTLSAGTSDGFKPPQFRPRKLSTVSTATSTIPMASVPLSTAAAEIIRTMNGEESMNWVCLKLDDKDQSFIVTDSRTIQDNDFGEALDIDVAFYLYADDTKSPTEFIFVMGVPDNAHRSVTIKYATVRHALVAELEKLLNMEIVKSVEIASRTDISYTIADTRKEDFKSKPAEIKPKQSAHPAQVPGSLANFMTKGKAKSLPKGVVLPPSGAYC